VDQERELLRRLWAQATDLADQWRLTLGRPYRAGPVSLVLPVRRGDGSAAVLKIPTLDEENRGEAEALRRYAGDGAVRLYDADAPSGALLLERLRPGTPLADHPDQAEAVDIVCGLLRRLRRPPDPAHPFPLVRELALRWAEELPALYAKHGQRRPLTVTVPEVGRSMQPSSALVEEAAALAHRLATPDGDELLVNRDAHLGNVLAALREPWLLIDPKPLVGERAFDAGWLLLELLGTTGTAAQARRLIGRLSDGLGVAADRVRAWGIVRAVETALWVVELGEDPSGDFAIAATLARLA
jgi:streptomycin 6-kinase